jgi:hypothetical protein
LSEVRFGSFVFLGSSQSGAPFRLKMERVSGGLFFVRDTGLSALARISHKREVHRGSESAKVVLQEGLG